MADRAADTAAVPSAAKAFVASRPLPTPPVVPALAVRVLRAAIPALDDRDAHLALARFSAPSRVGIARGVVADVLIAIVRAPAILGYMAVRVARAPQAVPPRADVLLYCGDRAYFEGRFARIAELLQDLAVCRAGDGLDTPCVPMRFDAGATVRVLAASLWAVPVLAALSLARRSNVLKGYLRACVTFARMLAFFRRHPSRAFLTYEENNCSAPVAAAFRVAGGTVLAAFQNGIWYNDEGFDHSVIDVLFPIGEAWADRHRHMGSRVGRAVPVGSLLLGCHPGEVAGIAKRYDVAFIDQGTPQAGAAHWSTTGPAIAERFLSFVRRYAEEHPHLRLAYLKRPYTEASRAIEQEIAQRFAGAPIELVSGDGFMKAYKGVAAAGVAVTIHSTLGLEAIAMGVTPLFCNCSGKGDYDVVVGTRQITTESYDVFAARVDAAAAGVLPPDTELQYFFGPDTSRAPDIIASELRRALND